MRALRLFIPESSGQVEVDGSNRCDSCSHCVLLWDNCGFWYHFFFLNMTFYIFLKCVQRLKLGSRILQQQKKKQPVRNLANENKLKTVTQKVELKDRKLVDMIKILLPNSEKQTLIQETFPVLPSEHLLVRLTSFLFSSPANFLSRLDD